MYIERDGLAVVEGRPAEKAESPWPRVDGLLRLPVEIRELDMLRLPAEREGCMDAELSWLPENDWGSGGSEDMGPIRPCEEGLTLLEYPREEVPRRVPADDEKGVIPGS